MSGWTGGDEKGATREYPAPHNQGPHHGKVWLAVLPEMTKALRASMGSTKLLFVHNIPAVQVTLLPQRLWTRTLLPVPQIHPCATGSATSQLGVFSRAAATKFTA